MLKIKPVSEKDANREVAEIYKSIENSLDLYTVPLIFQYFAIFPEYLFHIWHQFQQNINDHSFNLYCLDISNSAVTAIKEIYKPSAPTALFLEEMEENAQIIELRKFAVNSIKVNSRLYLLSVAIRESLKGKYLGLKQIGQKIENQEEEILKDLSNEFYSSHFENKKETTDDSNISGRQKELDTIKKGGLTKSYTEEFFKLITMEMERLAKKEDYLTRRVELERFTLYKLPLLTNPIDSSLTTVFQKNFGNPYFPELIYLISDLFPTQTPYKLLTSVVMKETLKPHGVATPPTDGSR